MLRDATDDAASGKLAEVRLTEDTSTLRFLLSNCYPVATLLPPGAFCETNQTAIRHIKPLCDCLEAAHKYELPKAKEFLETKLLQLPLEMRLAHAPALLAIACKCESPTLKNAYLNIMVNRIEHNTSHFDDACKELGTEALYELVSRLSLCKLV
jgi:hypothetical protein